MVEEREARLFRLFPAAPKSKLTMLKICNSLLRRLSKSHNTGACVALRACVHASCLCPRTTHTTPAADPPKPTFPPALCGRLMMYLSRNWDLSEPSALNKAGLANVANQTVYEDGEEFERQQVGVWVYVYIYREGWVGGRVGRWDAVVWCVV